MLAQTLAEPKAVFHEAVPPGDSFVEEAPASEQTHNGSLIDGSLTNGVVIANPLVEPLKPAARTSLAVLSMHTSPVSSPGSGDVGGLNVYVRELSTALAKNDTQVDIYVRRTDPKAPEHIEVAPGVRLTHIEAGPYTLPKEDLPAVVDLYADRVEEHLLTRPVNAIHAHYWLSAVAGHRLKHALEVPLAITFHTLARVKSHNGVAEPGHRAQAEQEAMDCAEVVFVSCQAERTQLQRLYDLPPERIKTLTPGVDPQLFTPGDRRSAQAALGLKGAAPLILFVGRLQPLKGAEIAVQALAQSRFGDARLMIVGGPSGPEGDRTLAELHQLVDRLGLMSRVTFVPPQSHHRLPGYYRAADVCVVPSRSESFGLVALEAASCGVPVVASNVGGLGDNITDGVTGLLVSERDPALFASQIDRLLEDPAFAFQLGNNGRAYAADHTWQASASAAAAAFAGLTVRELAACA